MKKLILFFTLISFISFGQNVDLDYNGEWTVSAENFENTLTLEKINLKGSTYKFTFFGWRDSYDRYARQVIKFSGEILGDHFIIEVRDNKAYYTDDALVLVDEFPLYSEGEERCEVYFTFNEDSITVKTKACHLIYGGFGVTFDGIYKKN